MEIKKLTSDKPWFVTMTFTNEVKLARCTCGNEWTPVDVSDTECFSCSKKEGKEK